MSSRSGSGRWSAARVLFSLIVPVVLAACGSGSGSGGSDYRVYVSVSGLQGNSVVLQLNGVGGTTVSKDETVNLGYLAAGQHYLVTVLTEPTNPTETCAVFNGEGSIGHSDVQDVSVTCSTHGFKVEHLVPAENSTNAWIHDPIVIRFFSSVDPSAITTDSLRVSANGAPLDRHIKAVDGDPNALEIQLVAQPAVPANMTVTLTGSIADTSGNRLIVPPEGFLTWSWQYPAWQALGGVALQNVDAADDTGWPAVTVSSSGDIFVAFSEVMSLSGGSGATVKALIVRHWNDRTLAWERLGDPLSVAENDGNVDRPSIAVDQSGSPIVAFIEPRGGVATVFVRRWNGSAWDYLDPTGLNKQRDSSNNPILDAVGPVIALDASGSPIVAWAEAGYHTPHVCLVRRWNNGWEDPIVVSRNADYDAIWPSIATAPSGPTYVVFTETNAVTAKLYMSRITWSAGSAATLEPAPDTSDYGFFLEGTANYAWSSVAASQDAVYVAHIQPSSHFAAVLRCTALTSCSSIGSSLMNDSTQTGGAPSIVVDESDHPYVAWHDWNPSNTVSALMVESRGGVTWEPVPGSPLAASPVGNPHAPQLAINGGTPVIVWREQPSLGQPNGIYLKRYNQ